MKDVFVCLDCETTGLDKENDQIIEIALVKFTFDKVLARKQTLVNPKCPIPKESTAIHHITQEMVEGKPLIEQVLPEYLKELDGVVLVGHKIDFDIDMIANAAKKHGINTTIEQIPFIDTLRLARLYGESPVNSLEGLQNHFNFPVRSLHRAMEDVLLNIDVFKKLTHILGFKNSKSILNTLKKPVFMKNMPLGKHKGRPLKEIPMNYLKWACFQDFDEDLMFSIKTELKNRNKKDTFAQVSNPFQDL